MIINILKRCLKNETSSINNINIKAYTIKNIDNFKILEGNVNFNYKKSIKRANKIKFKNYSIFLNMLHLVKDKTFSLKKLMMICHSALNTICLINIKT